MNSKNKYCLRLFRNYLSNIWIYQNFLSVKWINVSINQKLKNRTVIIINNTSKGITRLT